MNFVMLTLVTTALYSCGWKGSEGQQTWYCLPGSVHCHSTSLMNKCSQHCHFTFKLDKCWGCLSATTKYRLAHLLRLRWSLTDHKTLYKTYLDTSLLSIKLTTKLWLRYVNDNVENVPDKWSRQTEKKLCEVSVSDSVTVKLHHTHWYRPLSLSRRQQARENTSSWETKMSILFSTSASFVVSTSQCNINTFVIFSLANYKYFVTQSSWDRINLSGQQDIRLDLMLSSWADQSSLSPSRTSPPRLHMSWCSQLLAQMWCNQFSCTISAF